MARIFDKIQEWEIYVPAIDGGRERELYQAGDPSAITMELRFLTKAEIDRYARIAIASGKRASKDEENQIRKMLGEHVRNVTNYVYNGTQITDGFGIIDAGELDMVTDVTIALMQRSSLERGLAKKLSSPSDTSTEQQTKSADGDALGVTNQSNQGS